MTAILIVAPYVIGVSIIIRHRRGRRLPAGSSRQPCVPSPALHKSRLRRWQAHDSFRKFLSNRRRRNGCVPPLPGVPGGGAASRVTGPATHESFAQRHLPSGICADDVRLIALKLLDKIADGPRQRLP